ncbi:hypothetical protein GHI93_05630 [Lactococcus hircilactis]|uniref:Lipoprotein n=1 Tax=Lactococcus hircilactis TaxID=1494462 RepID=A0A7X1Z7T3_9LACT|nr:hypothetical protein [Lactococcus hircilactis]MQW39419.1 hypothetical protein [Lactococcus hircilactis]
MKKIVLLGATAIALLSLTACANTAKNTTSKNSATSNQTTTQTNQPFAFYKDAKTNSRIYYEISQDSSGGFGKDSAINAIIYVNHGKYTFYGTNNNYSGSVSLQKHLSLGDLKGKSNSKILKLAKQQNELFNSSLLSAMKQTINTAQSNPGSVGLTSQDIQTTTTLANEYKYNAPSPQTLEVEATSDSSGNNLGQEAILLPQVGSEVKYHDSMGKPSGNFYFIGTGDINFLPDEIVPYSLGYMLGAYVVYDKTYTVSKLSAGSGDDIYLATEIPTSSKAYIKTDSLNEKGMKQVNEISSEKLRTW